MIAKSTFPLQSEKLMFEVHFFQILEEIINSYAFYEFILISLIIFNFTMEVKIFDKSPVESLMILKNRPPNSFFHLLPL